MYSHIVFHAHTISHCKQIFAIQIHCVKQTQKTNTQVGQHLVWYINKHTCHGSIKSYTNRTEISQVISALRDKDQSGYWYNIFIAEVPSILILHQFICKKKKHQQTSKCTTCMTAGTHFVFSDIKQPQWVILPSILITNKAIENIWQELGV